MTRQRDVLNTLIDRLLAVTDGERNMYSYLRDLLSHRELGIRLAADQLVIDSSIGRGSGAPDVAIYTTVDGKAIKSPDHMLAVIEVKTGNAVARSEAAIFIAKTKYIQAGTRYFFLLDQEVVSRRWVEHGLTEPPEFFQWADLRNPEAFERCFGVISRQTLRLEDDLARFIEGRTRFAYRNIDAFGRRQFIATVREVSQRLHAAVDSVVQSRIRGDLAKGNELVAEMEADWGECRIDTEWAIRDSYPIEFARIVDEDQAKNLKRDEVDAYQEAHDRFTIAVEPYLYALEIEYAILPRYAARLGIDVVPGLNNPSKDSRKVVESFTYETASLIVSRMLMIRFSEDHDFMVRHISNGGVEMFSKYARHFKQPYQTLLRQTYDHARALYRGLFDRGVLDWVLAGDESAVSDALLHTMYLLSRWDFRSVHGDILSGVYDHYLETSKRRELGEVFTRPEIARHVLQRCGFSPGAGQLILDPACGTGTFIVEALEAELSRLRTAGLLSIDTVKSVLPQLCGMDINPFSVSLAQIQMLWHLMDLFTSDPKQAASVAAVVLPLLNIQGGRSSLEAMGWSMEKGQRQDEMALDVTRSSVRRKASTRFPARFRKLNSGKYDIVAGNPPYVRAHRRSAANLRDEYGEVATGQFDLYLLFIYRALRAWVKPGGRMGFIVPIALLDAGYAGALRSVLLDYRIVEIIDLELLRKKTFHGVKRPTLILIVENTPGSDDDSIVVTTVPSAAYSAVDDLVDMNAATSSTLKRSALLQETYLPGVDATGWSKLVDFAAGRESPWTTKVVPADLPVLQAMSTAPRLGQHVRTAFRKKRGKVKRIARTIPAGEKRYDWEEVLLISTGLKLGGKKALSDAGPRIYKGQNIFPGGLIGGSMGGWARGKEDNPYLYYYEEFLDSSKQFAIREIAQLPVACAVPADVVFQNTVVLVQLDTAFPLDAWCMSRVVQFYMAKVMRSTVIEDLSAHWYKRQIALMPVPPMIDDSLRTALAVAGSKVIHADRDLADQYRHVDELLGACRTTLQDAFLNADPRCNGLELGGVSIAPVALAGVREDGDALVADDLLFRAVVPFAPLRAYVLFHLERMIAEGADAGVTRGDLAEIPIPEDLEGVNVAIAELRARDARSEFRQALDALDDVVGSALGLSADLVDYVRSAMEQDPYLRELSILWEHRGARVQAYSDREGEDRYG